MTLLAIETSCDETSAAVVRDGEVLSNIVASQTDVHAEYGGVVPELATRAHLRNFIPITRTALCQANVEPHTLDAVAATRGPGLPSALLVGLKAGQALAYSLRKPVIGIHHHEAHLYSPWISGNPPRGDFANFEPSVSLIVSGGHTLLVAVKDLLNHRVLGGTVDDAAGECFDKIGKLMGLAYPAGPEIDRLAATGNPRAHDFPRPMLTEPGDDFSFSGLKTSVRYFLQKNPGLLDDPQHVRDLCASVQAAIVEVLVAKTVRAARRLGVRCVTASGGVICNSVLRSGLEKACKEKGLRLRLAEPRYSTDNAAMIGILAEQKLLSGVTDPSYDAEIEPSWPLSLQKAP
ncbi:MAG TPA: tRNA (adenosine(37)-N6)-threonylcarbamoyltransferase complex transferase subunit TsaD [Verrucomicrobiae bacterium]|jgi:N6-L-threonylcarbamoyladenine synthase